MYYFSFCARSSTLDGTLTILHAKSVARTSRGIRRCVCVCGIIRHGERTWTRWRSVEGDGGSSIVVNSLPACYPALSGQEVILTPTLTLCSYRFCNAPYHTPCIPRNERSTPVSCLTLIVSTLYHTHVTNLLRSDIWSGLTINPLRFHYLEPLAPTAASAVFCIIACSKRCMFMMVRSDVGRGLRRC